MHGDPRFASAASGGVAPGRHIAVVVPVYNDWASFYSLLLDMDAALAAANATATVLAVDDGSSEQVDATHPVFGRLTAVRSIEIATLACNLGHQRAIAVGLVLVSKGEGLAVIVMDSDGEDKPSDIPRLLAMADEHPHHIVCATRQRRSEGGAFRVGYQLYKLLFRCLTGVTINFGNFCLIPAAALSPLIFNPGIWNHLAATITRSRISFAGVPVTRGRRYFGRSKMHLVSLVSHGLSAISIYSESALVRILLALVALAILTACALVAVIAVRIFTEAAVPGWASIVGGSLLTLLLQAIAFSVFMAFFIHSGRSSPAVVPAFEADKFVLARTTVHPR
jgi:hypothetical protein